MAALGDQSEEQAMAAQPKPQNRRPISNIVIVVGTLGFLCCLFLFDCVNVNVSMEWMTAMQTEALPIVNRFQLTEDPHSPFVTLPLSLSLSLSLSVFVLLGFKITYTN